MVHTLLLLEESEVIVQDIVCSLRLVDIQVESFCDVDVLKSFALTEKPGMVLAGVKLKCDPSAGVRLAREFAEEPLLRDVPVILLCRRGEEKALSGDVRQLFQGVLFLPVEFPAFTKNVQQLLESIEKGEMVPFLDAQSVDGGEGVSASDSGEGDRQRLFIVYDIQQQVAERIRSSALLRDLDLQRVPQVVEAVTRELCLRYNRKG